MKTRNLFLSLFAFAALCACNKEAQPETPQVLGDDAYLSVRITAEGVDTKAGTDGGFENGAATENKVKNVLFAFFTADGNFLYTREHTNFEWTAGNFTPNVEKQSNATVVLDGKTIVPRQMVVILNYNTDIKTKVNGISNLSDLYNTISTSVYSWEESPNTYFVMSNSSYANGTVNAFAAQIDETDIYHEGDTPSADQIVDVYVERVAAKLTVETSATLNTESKTLDLNNGTTITYYPIIEGYEFTGTRNASHICKNIEGLYSSLNTNWPGWNDPANKRSYWAMSDATAGISYVDYDDVTNASGYATYCHENTLTSGHTKLIVKASIRKQEGSTQAPATDPKLSVIKVGASYYIKSDLVTAIVAELLSAGAKWNNGSTDQAYTAEHIKFTPIEGGTGYETKIELTQAATSATEAAANSVMSQYATVLLWDDGQAYFSTKIEHFGNAATGTDYGVVRNHIYNLTINKISGLGTPFAPGIGGDGGDPVTPTEIDYELQAKINILDWKVVNQEVELN